MSRKTKIIISVVVLVVIVGAVAYFALGSKGSGPQIDTATVAKKDLAVTVTASGKVEAGVQAEVFAPTQGTLSDVFVTDGQSVKAGQKLAQMDVAPIKAQLAQAKSGLATARAQYLNAGATGGGSSDRAAAKAAVTAANASVTAAKAGASAALAAYKSATDAYDMASAMLPSNSPTLTSLSLAQDQAYAGYRSAQAGVKQALAGLKQAQAGLSKVDAADPSASKAAAKAGMDAAQQSIDLLQKQVDDATLVAPIDGVVVFGSPAGSAALLAAGGSAGTLAEGSAVTPGSAVFTVVDLGALKFTAEVDEADIDRVKAGLESEITLDAFPGETFKTKVTLLNPTAQPTATGGTIFAVELPLTDTGKNILIGMKGDATIKVSSTGAALTIPVEALFSEGGTDFVYVVENAKLKKTEITVGATTDTEVEVMQGLSDGQVVALSGSTQFTDGMAVRVKK